MKRIVRKGTRALYLHVAKPILFRKSPDAVHTGLVGVGKVVQILPGIKQLPSLWEVSDPVLSQTVCGIGFSNPVGLSAGFDKNIELVPLMKSVGFGFMTGGSVTSDTCVGNSRPWFQRLPKSKSLIVHAGLPNSGVDTIAKQIDKYTDSDCADFPLIVSVAKTNTPATVDELAAIDDYRRSLTRLEDAKNIQMYEINISCPNAFGGEPFTEPGKLERLLAAVDTLKLERPVIIKMPIDLAWREFNELLKVIVSHNVQGVAIGNLLKDRTRVAIADDTETAMPGGLSGLPTRDISTELIRQTYTTYGSRLTIIGIGGIFSATDAYEKICAGASLVGLITGMIYEGPQLIGEINADLRDLLKKDGFNNISAAIGSRSGV